MNVAPLTEADVRRIVREELAARAAYAPCPDNTVARVRFSPGPDATALEAMNRRERRPIP